MAKLSNEQLRRLLEDLEREEEEIKGKVRKKRDRMRRATAEEELREAIRVKKEEEGNGSSAGYRVAGSER